MKKKATYEEIEKFLNKGPRNPGVGEVAEYHAELHHDEE